MRAAGNSTSADFRKDRARGDACALPIARHARVKSRSGGEPDGFVRTTMRKLLLLILSALLACGALYFGERERANASLPESHANESATGVGRALDDTTPRAPLKLPLVKPEIVVVKSRRQLTLYSDGRVVRTYRVGLGLNPVDDKEREGDRRTPEGEFYIFTKNNKSAFYLSLGLSYPNAEDAERGLRDRLITKKQYNQIVAAIRGKRMPPQYTPLGGLIYIHGNGAGSDWTWGCVALEDEDIKELFDAVPLGTIVRIEH